MVRTPIDECWIDKQYEIEWLCELPDRGISFEGITVELLSKSITRGFVKCSGMTQSEMIAVNQEFIRAFGSMFGETVSGDMSIKMFVECFLVKDPPVRNRRFMLLVADKLVKLHVNPKYYNLYSLALAIIAVARCSVKPSAVLMAFEGLSEEDVRELVDVLPLSDPLIVDLDERFIWNHFVHTSLTA